MKIKVLFFAQLADLFGTAERVIEVEQEMTVGQIFQRLAHDIHLEKSLESLPILFAVNEEWESPDRALKNRDVLALMTPFAGG